MMTEVEFCIIVLWLHGYPIKRIHAWFGTKAGKSAGSIRGMVDRGLPKPRAQMSKEERQHELDRLFADRMDGGVLPDNFFKALPLKSRQKPVEKERKPPVKAIEKKKLTKSMIRAQIAREERERAIRELGGAPRGVETAALEILKGTGLLADPKEMRSGSLEDVAKGARDRRFNAGIALRSWLSSAYMSGMKTQNYESVGGGGGGAGVVIHAHVAEAVNNLIKLKTMMTREEFDLLNQIIVADRFAWEVPSKVARAMILEDIRRGLDIVSFFLDTMPLEDFRKRWGSVPKKGRAVNQKAARRRSRDANKAIAAAARKI